MLQEHGLYSLPVNPVVLANKLGIRVMRAFFSEENFSGLIARRSEAGTTILVNEKDHPIRQRFTIAHELGHALLHLQDQEEFVDRDSNFFRSSPYSNEAEWTLERRREFEANVFASELLMPSVLVKELWYRLPREERVVKNMAVILGVSEEAIGYKLADLRLFEGESL
ncbi:ImmA/IrrE family metallo-endopeptidase [Nannocystis punicea]|uniref:ImmA/IrrE family metallo-endopeptidase n=1 Tax=Nannocystis punicea TaxID=2995304 RepID=A0ABY7HBB0_9BACT|nr:ImmA/IrrE family metallo-endopeptidase [Nannocystis poenicansa]WAS96392.1 ImmA/IrrE family metallo-endopeptidase [Nannocystis poenicansa]